MVIGQVHELVDQIWLVQVAGQWAQLLVGIQPLTARNHGDEKITLFNACLVKCLNSSNLNVKEVEKKQMDTIQLT